MSWQHVGRWGPYYYRHERVDGRVRKIYVGRGEAAKAAAGKAEAKRDLRQTEREEWRAEQARLAGPEQCLGDLDTLTNMLVRIVLEKAKFRYVRGYWRRKRHD